MMYTNIILGGLNMQYEKYDYLRSMRWGFITPDLTFENNIYDIVHIFNHNLGTDDSIKRTIRFIIGRIRWFEIGLRQKLNHKVVIDDFGQDINQDVKNQIRTALSSYASIIIFDSEREKDVV